MIRQHLVRPDAVMQAPTGQVPYVSRETLQEEILRALDVAEFAGGGFTYQAKRYPTGVPHESVTTGAIIQWFSHTQGSSKTQPEQHEPLADPTPEQLEDQLEREEMEHQATAGLPDPPDDDEPVLEFEEEDNSALPEELRS